MSMRNFLADNFCVDLLNIKCFLLREGDFFCNFEIFSNIWYIPNPTIVLFRNNKSVTGGERTNIQESEEVFILINFVSWYFTFYDFAKNTIFHISYYTFSW